VYKRQRKTSSRECRHLGMFSLLHKRATVTGDGRFYKYVPPRLPNGIR